MVEHKLGGVPHFCVNIRHDENREKVQIPVEFLEFMPKGLSGSAVLRGLSNRHWTVKLSLEAYCLFITEGWDRFFEENALCQNDFLVFRHSGGGETEKFDVRIFDKHGRERLDVSDAVGPSATNQEIKKEDTNVAFGRKEKGCKHSENNTLSGLQGENLGDGLLPGTSVHTRSVRNRDGPAKIGDALMNLGENQGDGLPPGTSVHTRSVRNRDGPAKIGDPTMNLGENLGDGLPPGTSVHTRSVRNRDGPAKIGIATMNLGENLSIGLQPETSCKRKRDGPAESGVPTMSLDRNDTTEVAMSAWSKSLAFSSSNPFFKCILTKQHLQKYHLSIPREMTYPGLLPTEKTMIVLRNLKDEVWVVGVAPNTGGHSFISGWHKFANENNLMEGNVCIFELVTRNELLVHVFN